MTNPNSSLAHLYPTDFKQDFIGKHRYWMGIPYLPQLEINLVNRTFKKYEKIMSEKNYLIIDKLKYTNLINF